MENMQPTPKVSIIIPVYNGANYMSEAIDSALAQTYSNTEVLVINDGSEDNGDTESIALSYRNKIRYFAKPNGGVSTALNLGIEKMTGEYFSWLSHDDLYKPEKIEAQMEILQSIPFDTILYSGYQLINEKSKKFGQVDPGVIYPEKKLNVPMFPVLRGLLNGCTLLIHRSHFERVGMFDLALRSTQDYDLWFRMFREANIKFHRGLYVKTRSHKEQGTNTMPKHEEECSKLWINMMDSLTDDEMHEMEGSIYAFRKKTEEFLRENTSFNGAIAHAETLSKQAENEIKNEINNSKVSVIIPFYNRIPLLLSSIQSVQNQSHKNFEILLIDDGTTDDLTLVTEMINKDNRIHYFLQNHKGASAARNLGIQEANGDYIAFLDSDDMFVQDKFKIQLNFMIRNGYEFCHTSYQKITVDEHPLGIVNSGVFSGFVFPRILSSCGIATPTVMLRKNIINEHRFMEEYVIGEDTCFWIDLAFQHSLGGIEQPLTLVRVNHTSAAYNLDKQILGLQNIASHIIRNSLYLPFENEIYFLLYDLMTLFRSKNEMIAVAQDTQGILAFGKPNSRLKRLFISLGYNGFSVTIRKILYKIKLKLLRR